MTPAVISLLIMVGVGIMVVIALTVQSIENARKERHRQALALRERIRIAEDLLTSIPSEYLTPQQRQLLLSYMIGRYREILLLEPRDRNIPAKIRHLEELAQQPYQSQPDNPTPVFADQLSAQAARTRIKEFASLVITMHKEGALDKTTARQYIQAGKLSYALLGMDIALITARAVDHSDNPRLALSHYQMCLKTAERLSEHLTLERKQASIEQRIEELKQQIRAEENQRPDSNEVEADQEWEEFTDQNWQIKQEYE